MRQMSENREWWDEREFSPLHKAAYSGDTEDVALLLQEGADPNVRDSQGNTPLYWASFKSGCSPTYSEAVEALLAAGADTTLRAPEGNPPLVEACRAGSADVVRLLLQAGANPNHYFDRRPPIVAAAQSGCTECVTLLLKAGADPSAKGEFRMTAREWAESNGFNDIIMVLDAGVDS